VVAAARLPVRPRAAVSCRKCCAVLSKSRQAGCSLAHGAETPIRCLLDVGCCGREGIFHIPHLLAGHEGVGASSCWCHVRRAAGRLRRHRPGLATVTALSLSSLRKRIEAQLPPTEAVKLELDRVARRERDRRRAWPPGWSVEPRDIARPSEPPTVVASTATV
jgi:hypothetical protein